MKPTDGPWAWRKLGGQWHLVQDVGPRQVILTAGLDNSVSDWDSPGSPELLTRDPATGQLVAVEPGQANAALIASAPDLLAACEAALAKFAEYYLSRTGRMPDAVRLLEAAVAKAKGEQP